MKYMILTIAAAVAAVGCAGSNSSSDSAEEAPAATSVPGTGSSTGAGDEPLGLNVGVYPGAFHSLVQHVALEEGIFAKHGLEVDLVNTSSGPEAIATLASGGISVMINSPGNQLLANAQGQDFVGIIGGLHKPFYTWVAQVDWPTPNENAGYPEAVQDFAGARIGVTARGAETELFTRAFLIDAGLNPDEDVSWVGVGIGAQAVGAFEAEQIDILVAVEPSQTLLVDINETGKSMLDLRLGEGPERFKSWPSLAWMGTRQEVEGDPDRFSRYQAAIAETFDFMADETNKERVVEIYGTILDLGPEALGAIYDNNISTIGATFDCEAYGNVLDFMLETEQLSEEDAAPCTEVMWTGAADYMIGVEQ